jgi:uncharacterized membrane protein YhaH (DUF805 family)
MEKIKKYFQFSGTINGTNYFYRNLLSYLSAFIGGLIFGIGIGKNDMGLSSLGILIIVPAVVFGFATLYKRMFALFGGDATSYTTGLILIQLLSQFLSEGPFKSLASVFLVIFSLVLVFKNSGKIDHCG